MSDNNKNDIPIASKDNVTDVTNVQVQETGAFYETANITEGVTGVTGIEKISACILTAIKPAAEAAAENIVAHIPSNQRPCYHVYDDWAKLDSGERLRPGVYWLTSEKKGEDTILHNVWICSPLHITAQTSDKFVGNFGRLLKFKNTLRTWKTWSMPMELLRGSGEELRGELLSMGLLINPDQHKLFMKYLQHIPPKKEMRCALQTGWHDKTFVLPDTVIGPEAEDIIFQSGTCAHGEHGLAGSLQAWQEGVSVVAQDNPMLMLGLSCAFAAPLLERCNAEGGGIHLVGDSSSGKTTILDAACSVYGGKEYRRTWRSTANGMEGTAVLYNDCLLPLDEISECDPKEVAAIAYLLGNGTGKQRAGKSGAAKAPARWRCFILSTGERAVATTINEAGSRAKAGQAIRLIDIFAGRQFGCWDTLCGHQNGASFSDAIKKAASKNYGYAGRCFIERLSFDTRDFAAELEVIKNLPEFQVIDAEGQEKRAGTRFAIIAYAGELATEYGITGWEKCAAIKAASIAFKAWCKQRGKGNDEQRQLLESLADFIDKHRDSRFSDIAAQSDNRLVQNRAGYWDDSNGKKTYYFNTPGMREALTGFDFKRSLVKLSEYSVIPQPGSSKEHAKPMRVNGGAPIRLYEINYEILMSYIATSIAVPYPEDEM
jgi:putative DNA primase/helicase